MVDLKVFADRWCVRCERKTRVRQTLRSEPEHLEGANALNEMKKTERSRSWGKKKRGSGAYFSIMGHREKTVKDDNFIYVIFPNILWFLAMWLTQSILTTHLE